VWKDLGFVLLENDNKRVKINEYNSIVIAGISDPQALKTKIKPEEKEKILALDNYKMLTDIETYHGVDLEKALNGINLEKELVVMMSHKPAEFEGISKYNVFLTLSGHTHGGMLPILKTIVSWFNNSYVSGVYKKGTEEQPRNLIVSNGIYLWSGFFARINIPGEVVVIDIKGK
jgi:predicted MPP superfamily phosphohydrolase